MSQSNVTMKATGGREASRERRTQLGQGKAGLPPATNRSRMGEREAANTGVANIAQPAKPVATPAVAQSAPAPVTTDSNVLTGRDASRTRRAGLVQGKQGIVQTSAAVQTTATAAAATPRVPVMSGSGRQAAQALRGSRARNGRGRAESTRPCGRVRHSAPLTYPAKVANTETYAGKKVTGIRIGRSANMTGDEPGADVQVTGSQYIGKETGFNPREGGLKVGAARTANGQVVTGSQVRSKIMITGDESNSAIRITGEADQEINDDLLNRREQGAYASMQFQRQNNPHGHTVFGANLGRSIKSIGSRDRDREHAIEQTDGGLPVSGTAVGRSLRITGDEPGACRSITGTQYLMPGNKQPLCATAAAPARTGSAMGMSCNSQGKRPDPVTGEKVVESETWTRQRITGVDVEHNPNVSGDEYGVCASVTGTPYAGPGQYETACATDAAANVAQRVMPGQPSAARVTGDAVFNAEHVTGTQRGGDHSITGTPYFRAQAPEGEMTTDAISNIDRRFSVRSPQREGHLYADASAVEAPSAETRITGAFAVGDGKITGNQEFHFNPRGRTERDERKSRITGEGRMEGPAITGSAWTKQNNVTGTEGHIAVERNPSERSGKSHAFANASKFKGKGNHEAPTQHVTGMVGWSASSAARVTLSGGAQG